MGVGSVAVDAVAGSCAEVIFGGRRHLLFDAGMWAATGTEAVAEVYGLAIGDRVQHATWGAGSIEDLTVDRNADLASALVRFDGPGLRTLDLDREDLKRL